MSSRAGNPFSVLATTNTSYVVSGFRPVVTHNVGSNYTALLGKCSQEMAKYSFSEITTIAPGGKCEDSAFGSVCQ